MTTNSPHTGIILSYQSNFYTVKVNEVTYQCFLKGILKKEGTDVLVGDRVVVDNLDEINRSGRVVQVLERTNQLTRPKIANITKALVVASIQSPTLEVEQLDRYLTQVLLAGIEPMVCITKVDLAEGFHEIEAIQRIYEPLGIPVFTTTIKDPYRIKALFIRIHGETVVLAGLSGVGKSSLLNAFRPDLQLSVGEVSDKIQRGQHTTRHVALMNVEDDTYVADTPGFSYLKFDTVSPQAIESVFQDFELYRPDCHFQDCLHVNEADCAVKANLDKIASSRYASYLAFLEEAKAYMETVQTTSQKQEYGYKTLKKGKEETLQVLKLREKQRQASRRTQRQQITDWSDEGDTLEEE